MQVQLGVSNKHVHLTEEDYYTLFGNNNIKVDRYLYQPHQFASTSYVTIKTDKNSFSHVRVIGPFRNYTQVEISKTDAYYLGINPPIRDSGDIKNSSEVEIIGPVGKIKRTACIIPTRHIHMTPQMLKEYNLVEQDKLEVTFKSEKETVFKNVKICIREESNLELHLDTDDSNGALLKTGDIGEFKKQ